MKNNVNKLIKEINNNNLFFNKVVLKSYSYKNDILNIEISVNNSIYLAGAEINKSKDMFIFYVYADVDTQCGFIDVDLDFNIVDWDLKITSKKNK